MQEDRVTKRGKKTETDGVKQPETINANTNDFPTQRVTPTGSKTKNKKRILILIASLLIFIVFSICGYLGCKYAHYLYTIKTKDSTVLQSPKALEDAHNAFGFNLVRTLSSTSDNKNVIVSPTSVSLSMSMVYAGANGDTKSEIKDALQLQNLNDNQIDQQSKDLIDSIKNTASDEKVSIADAAWIKDDFKIKTPYLNKISNFYETKASSLDFNNPSAIATINKWANESTNGKIPTIISSIDPGAKLILTNATYFYSNWTSGYEFSSDNTDEENFTTSAGSTNKVEMMNQENYLSYLETDGFQSVKLPYGSSKRYEMVIFLPDNLKDFISKLTVANWNKWMGDYEYTHGELSLPRYKLEGGCDLKDPLTALGMGKMFSAEQANLSGIADTSKSDNLYISQVLHKTHISVDESGTEAAAVTAAEVAGAGDAKSDDSSFKMNVNRPFFFAIHDTKTGEILFDGAVNELP